MNGDIEIKFEGIFGGNPIKQECNTNKAFSTAEKQTNEGIQAKKNSTLGLKTGIAKLMINASNQWITISNLTQRVMPTNINI